MRDSTFMALVAIVLVLVIVGVVALSVYIVHGNREAYSEEVSRSEHYVSSVELVKQGPIFEWLYDDVYVIKTSDGKTFEVLERHIEIVRGNNTNEVVCILEDITNNFGSCYESRYVCKLYLTDTFKISE